MSAVVESGRVFADVVGPMPRLLRFCDAFSDWRKPVEPPGSDSSDTSDEGPATSQTTLQFAEYLVDLVRQGSELVERFAPAAQLGLEPMKFR